MSRYPSFDYLVINEVFDDALAELCAIVKACRLATPRQILRHQQLLSQLLA
jgi:guanylate kinase